MRWSNHLKTVGLLGAPSGLLVGIGELLPPGGCRPKRLAPPHVVAAEGLHA